MIEPVARTICRAAGTSVSDMCNHCEVGSDGALICTQYPLFMDEARAAIKTVYRWHKENRRWPSFVKEARG